MPDGFLKTPPVDGLCIGLYGGSFDPVHRGHLAVSLEALKRLRLDRLWWLVSPQNPLKSRSETTALAARLAQTSALARHPRFWVSDLEQRLGTRTTAETFAAMRPLFRRGRFVWIMGADSFADLHKWNDWQAIPQTLPIAVFDRPGWTMRALSSPAAQRYASARRPASQAALLCALRAPAWTFLTLRRRPESSSAIRNMLPR